MRSKRVVVTRAAHQADELVSLLEARGAIPLLYPCIAVVLPEDSSRFDEGIRGCVAGSFDWLVFTSVNTVFALSSRLVFLGIPSDRMTRTKIATIGVATARAVRSMLHAEVEIVPEEHESEHLAAALGEVGGTRVFLPKSDIAPATLEEMLTRAGADVFDATAYRTVIGKGGADVPRLLERNEVDAVTFTSSSTVTNFVERLTGEGGTFPLHRSVCVACLGRKTARTAKEAGFHVTVTSLENTLESLVAAVAEHFGDRVA